MTVYEGMLEEMRLRGLDGDVLLRWAAWRVSHGGAKDAAERFLLVMADLEYLGRVRVADREIMGQVLTIGGRTSRL